MRLFLAVVALAAGCGIGAIMVSLSFAHLGGWTFGFVGLSTVVGQVTGAATGLYLSKEMFDVFGDEL